MKAATISGSIWSKCSNEFPSKNGCVMTCINRSCCCLSASFSRMLARNCCASAAEATSVSRRNKRVKLQDSAIDISVSKKTGFRFKHTSFNQLRRAAIQLRCNQSRSRQKLSHMELISSALKRKRLLARSNFGPIAFTLSSRSSAICWYDLSFS